MKGRYVARAPFQVLVIPYRFEDDGAMRYALFRRSERGGGYWQAIAGGGEDGESAEDAARREAYEEAGISVDATYVRLSTVTSIPVVNFAGTDWGDDVLVIPEYAFGVEVTSRDLTISDEHVEYCWVPYGDARDLVRWDSNRTALWELNRRLTSRSRTGP
jgi:dATP pyrophosphohydrolase